MLKYKEINYYKLTPDSGLLDHEPLRLDELQNLLELAEGRGYTVTAAQNMKSYYDAILSDIYSVWFALEHEVVILADNIAELISLVGWKRENQVSQTVCQQA